jgi:hypothetical protein
MGEGDDGAGAPVLVEELDAVFEGEVRHGWVVLLGMKLEDSKFGWREGEDWGGVRRWGRLLR